MLRAEENKFTRNSGSTELVRVSAALTAISLNSVTGKRPKDEACFPLLRGERNKEKRTKESEPKPGEEEGALSGNQEWRSKPRRVIRRQRRNGRGMEATWTEALETVTGRLFLETKMETVGPNLGK